MEESKQAKDAADRFISRLKEGVITKKIAPNSSEEYPDDKALESFKNFIGSEQFQPIIANKVE
jgi:hypothetical protein